MKVVTWLERIQEQVRKELDRGMPELAPWEPLPPGVEEAYVFLRTRGGTADPSASASILPFFDLLTSETIRRRVLAMFAALPPDAADMGPERVEALLAQVIFAEPPLKLFRTALEAFFSVRTLAPLSAEAYFHELRPLERCFAELGPPVTVDAVGLLSFVGFAVQFPYVKFRQNPEHRPVDPEALAFHEEVERLFHREGLGQPTVDDLTDLMRVFDDSRPYAKVRKSWFERRKRDARGGKGASRNK